MTPPLYHRCTTIRRNFDTCTEVFTETFIEGDGTAMSFAVAKLGNTKILIHISFLLAAIVMIGAGYTLYFVVFAGSLLVHEMGHLIAAAFLETEISEIEIWAFGAVGRLEGAWQIEPWSEAMIAISGPMQSALLAVLGVLGYHGYAAMAPGLYASGQFPLLQFLIRVNLGLLAVNLLPCLPLDGGRFFRAQLSLKLGYKEASYQLSKLGVFVGVCLCILGSVGLITGGRWFSLVILGPLLIWSAIEERNMVSFNNILALLARSRRLAQTGALPVEELMVSEKARVKELVHRLRPSRYYVLLVVDRQMNLLGSVSETVVLEAFYKGQMDLKVSELLSSSP